MIPFYLTTFNSPWLCKSLLESLKDLAYSGQYRCIISDKSEEKFAEIYKDLAAVRNIEYLHYPNKGATQAKLSVLDHAVSVDAEFCMQISEDFIRNYRNEVVISGSDSFDTDSLTILQTNPELYFCKWNILTGHNGDMTYLYTNPSGKQIYRVQNGIKLPFLTGDIVYSNWPAVWRVNGVRQLREKAKLWAPPNDFHNHRNVESGGEWAVSMSSFGRGACLVAQPFFHPDRVKDKGSRP